MAFLSPATRALGPVLSSQMQGAVSGTPLPLSESMVLVWPQLTGLVAAVILFESRNSSRNLEGPRQEADARVERHLEEINARLTAMEAAISPKE